ncbi:nicotinate ribosyltransferase [Arthrobacter phage Qui]|uniref:Nicotinate ribosyltransferase n=1 Tax=Arthrobacter phage Qui TaxID=2603260 RepID=A0A5B8WIM2_9CAUD|nr:nicotinate ribosyltransferase [Arthrobacter phage Qui]QED11617.1 nicotinate ribosyltransferase [Arthrobacter phage Qui]QOC56449.1 nicotinate ribosyltransferase [Arthrobacter phage Paella]
MSTEQVLSWAVTAIGIFGFFMAGKKVWWSWYINLSCQALWFAYAFYSGTPAFFFAASFYTIVFGWNAYKWTKAHFLNKAITGQYRTKSSPVDAMYFEGGHNNASKIMDWLLVHDVQAWWKEPAASYVNENGRYLKQMPETIRILDREGTLDLVPGEYVVLGSNNRVYIFEQDAFESVYERVS